MTTLVGYVRVARSEEPYQDQVDALDAAGCERIFVDVAGGRCRARHRDPPVSRGRGLGGSRVLHGRRAHGRLVHGHAPPLGCGGRR
nr:hypothetical protein [Clavibacter michiganensis]